MKPRLKITMQDIKSSGGTDWAHIFELSMSLYAPLQGILVFTVGITFIQAPTVVTFAILLSLIYLFPLLTSRFIARIVPVREGKYRIGRQGVEGWVLQLKVQMFLAAFPFFERVLHIVPGLFSLWLRSWGSQIGRGVIWTPHIDVLDRGLLQIEDGVLLGYKVILSSHLVFMKDGEHYVYCNRIKIGKSTLIGGVSILGPGVKIGEGCRINVSSIIYPDQIIPSGASYDERKINS